MLPIQRLCPNKPQHYLYDRYDLTPHISRATTSLDLSESAGRIQSKAVRILVDPLHTTPPQSELRPQRAPAEAVLLHRGGRQLDPRSVPDRRRPDDQQ